jgi:hypothetical protein
MNRLIVLIGALTIAFSIAVSVAVFWLLDSSEKSTREASNQLAAALERNDASAAPEGASAYVDGVRAYFGPVRSAVVIDARNKGINTGDSADTRSFFVADLLLETERGPAVIEVEFDNHSFANRSQEVSAVYELAPDDVPDGKLHAAEREDLVTAFEARGGEAAQELALSRAPMDLPEPGKPAESASPPAESTSPATEHLRCVQDADGDVTKIQRCSEAS